MVCICGFSALSLDTILTLFLPLNIITTILLQCERRMNRDWKGGRDEKNLSAEQTQKKKRPRIPYENGDQDRTSRFESKTLKRS